MKKLNKSQIDALTSSITKEIKDDFNKKINLFNLQFLNSKEKDIKKFIKDFNDYKLACKKLNIEAKDIKTHKFYSKKLEEFEIKNNINFYGWEINEKVRHLIIISTIDFINVETLIENVKNSFYNT